MKTFKLTSNGDIYISPTGRLVYIDGHDKLNQDVEKILQTQRDPTDAKRPNVDYGSDLLAIVGMGQTSLARTQKEVASTIRSALTTLKEIQTEKFNSLSNKLKFPRRERIWGMEGIQVIINDTEPREVNWKVIIIDQEGVESQKSRLLVGATTTIG